LNKKLCKEAHSIVMDSWQSEGTLHGFGKQVKFKDIYLKIIFVGNLIFKNPANLKLKFVGSFCSWESKKYDSIPFQINNVLLNILIAVYIPKYMKSPLSHKQGILNKIFN